MNLANILIMLWQMLLLCCKVCCGFCCRVASIVAGTVVGDRVVGDSGAIGVGRVWLCVWLPVPQCVCSWLVPWLA